MTFTCGHPREGNEKRGQCAFCIRMKTLARAVDRRQARINAGLPATGTKWAWL